MRNDPAFGIRILVEIAGKAFSSAINDPGTTILAIDQIGQLLRMLGQRQIGVSVVRDPSGDLRLVYRTPYWDDYVALAVTEIRLFGVNNPAVTRRLQVMLEGVEQGVPEGRRVTVRKEMLLLQRGVARAFSDPEDRILSGIDELGIGSRRPGYSEAERR